jgi:LysR family transcriptional regulator, glycine cleavage system transcriptional activator
MTRPQRLPPIHALAAFESAARLGGFGQAAAELCITPSAVSHRIRMLELQLGETLFDRLPTGVRLTDAGQRYLHVVREAFDKLALLSRRGATEVPRLRVGAPPTFARNMLIPNLPEFYRQRPDIEIEVAVVMPMQERPDRHDVDIRFGNGRFDERETIKLFDDELQVLAAPRYLASRAVDRPADLTRAELLRSPLIAWRPWFAAAGLDRPEPAGGLAFTDLGILLEAAASELGVAICLQRVAVPWTSTGQLLPLFGITAPAASTYHVLVERDLSVRPEVASFVDWLTATFA